EALIPVGQCREHFDMRRCLCSAERAYQRGRAERARAQVRRVIKAQDQEFHASLRHWTRVLTWPPSKRNTRQRLPTLTPKRGCQAVASDCSDAPVASNSAVCPPGRRNTARRASASSCCTTTAGCR